MPQRYSSQKNVNAKDPRKFRGKPGAVFAALLLIILLLEGIFDLSLGIFGIIFLVVAAIVCLSIHAYSWSCPHCGKYLSRSNDAKGVCPHCGKPLPKDTDETK